MNVTKEDAIHENDCVGGASADKHFTDEMQNKSQMEFEIHLDKCKEIGMATIKENQKLQSEITKLRGERIQIDQFTKRIMKENESLQTHIGETNRKHSDMLTNMNERYVASQKDITFLQRKLSFKEKRNDELTKLYEEASKKIEILQREKHNLIAKHDRTDKQLHAQIKTLTEKNKEQNETEDNLRRSCEENKLHIMRLTNHYHDQVKQVQLLQEEKTSLNREKQELSLSIIGGAELSNENPNLVDLSDEMRPTKLAEKFSEVYDNEWTDAFEELEYKDEHQTIYYMLNILKKASQICSDFSNGHSRRIKDSFCTLTVTPQSKQEARGKDRAGQTLHRNQSDSDVEGSSLFEEISIRSDFELLQGNQKETIMESKNFFERALTKDVEATVVDQICKAFKIKKDQGALVKYIAKCVNICWLMCRHNPPVHMEFPEVTENMRFDTNKFNPYTISGKYIDFIVWPALFLHEGGPLLCRGVAQGC